MLPDGMNKLPDIEDRKEIPPFFENIFLERPISKSNNSAYISYRFTCFAFKVSLLISVFSIFLYLVSGTGFLSFDLNDNGKEFLNVYVLAFVLLIIPSAVINYSLVCKAVDPKDYNLRLNKGVSSKKTARLLSVLVAFFAAWIVLSPSIVNMLVGYYEVSSSLDYFAGLILFMALALTGAASMAFNMSVAVKFLKVRKNN